MGIAQGNNDMRKMIIEARKKLEQEKALAIAAQQKFDQLELKRGKSALGMSTKSNRAALDNVVNRSSS